MATTVHEGTPPPVLQRLQRAGWAALLYPVATLALASIPVLAKLSQNASGGYDYSSFVMVMCTECFKLVISTAQYTDAVRRDPAAAYKPSVTEFWLLLMPSLLYAITNNLQMVSMSMMDPSTFRVLQNLKIVTTAVLWRVAFKKALPSHQWIAICFLAMGSLSLSAPGSATADASATGTSLAGLLLVATQCTLSGLASIASEYVFKHKGVNVLPAQNMVLYAQSIALNLLLALVSHTMRTDPSVGVASASLPGLFGGFTMAVWLLVAVRSVVGVLISMIFKHGGAIVYTLVTATATPVAAVMAYALFGTILSLQNAASSVIVLLAVYLYNAHLVHEDIGSKPGAEKALPR